MTTHDYIPDTEFLEKLFEKDKIYTNFLFKPLNYEPEFDKIKFAEVGSFCKMWKINPLLASDLYYITKRILPANTLDGYQKISDMNSSEYTSVMNLRSLKDENLKEITIRAGKKSITIKDSAQLKKIKKYLLKYADKEELNYEKTNFRSEAYSIVSKLIDRYFKHKKIEQSNNKKRYEMIGRLMIIAGLTLRSNQYSNDARKRVREDFVEFDSEVKGRTLSDTVRNWVKKID